jgi:single-strand DNA-binding protein
MSYSRVIIMGNLTRDPEIRYLQSGDAVCQIGVAINKRWKDKDSGEVREKVTFVDCTAFGPRAESLAQYFKKGKAILVEGELELDQWEDKQTQQKRSKLKVKVTSWSFIPGGGGEEGSRDTAPTARPTTLREKGQAAAEDPQQEPEDDVPF